MPPLARTASLAVYSPSSNFLATHIPSCPRHSPARAAAGLGVLSTPPASFHAAPATAGRLWTVSNVSADPLLSHDCQQARAFNSPGFHAQFWTVKLHLSMFSRDATWPTDLLSHFISFRVLTSSCSCLFLVLINDNTLLGCGINWQ